jgi:hypothetical protein
MLFQITASNWLNVEGVIAPPLSVTTTVQPFRSAIARRAALAASTEGTSLNPLIFSNSSRRGLPSGRVKTKGSLS